MEVFPVARVGVAGARGRARADPAKRALGGVVEDLADQAQAHRGAEIDLKLRGRRRDARRARDQRRFG